MPLEPDTAAMLDAARRAAAANPAARTISDLPLAEARAGYAARYAMRGPARDPGVEEVAVEIPSRAGAIPARLFRRPGGVPPLLLYLHGGGYVVGGGDTYAAQCSALAGLSGAAVLLPDVRLAPEHPFPAAWEDATAALRFAAAGGIEGVDTGRLVLGGDSAGGALALHAVLSAPDARVRGLALAYPWVDARTYRGGAGWPSVAAFGEGYWLDTATMRWFAEAVWPDATDAADPRASPLLSPAFAGLPRTWLTVADHDPLLDPCLALAGRMLADGVEVSLRIERGLIHNFLGHGALSAGARAAFSRYAAAVAELAG